MQLCGLCFSKFGILPHEYALLTEREKAIMIAQLQIDAEEMEKQNKKLRKKMK